MKERRKEGMKEGRKEGRKEKRKEEKKEENEQEGFSSMEEVLGRITLTKLVTKLELFL